MQGEIRSYLNKNQLTGRLSWNQFLCLVRISQVGLENFHKQCLSGRHACYLFPRAPCTMVFYCSCKLYWNSWSDWRPMWRIPCLLTTRKMFQLQWEHRQTESTSSGITSTHRIDWSVEETYLQQGEERGLLPDWRGRTTEYLAIKANPRWRRQ